MTLECAGAEPVTVVGVTLEDVQQQVKEAEQQPALAGSPAPAFA